MFEKITTQAISILGDDISVATIYGVRETEEDYKNGFPQIDTKTLQAKNTDFSDKEASAIVNSISVYCNSNPQE